MYRKVIRSFEHLEELKPLLLGQLIRMEWGTSGTIIGICIDVDTNSLNFGAITVDPDTRAGSYGPTLYTIASGYAVHVTTADDIRDTEERPPALIFHELR